jgi:hypothetical protein
MNALLMRICFEVYNGLEYTDLDTEYNSYNHGNIFDDIQ